MGVGQAPPSSITIDTGGMRCLNTSISTLSTDPWDEEQRALRHNHTKQWVGLWTGSTKLDNKNNSNRYSTCTVSTV